jgi:hypothetical protein
VLSMPREQEALREADLADELATGRLDSTICSCGRCIREARARSSPGLADAPTGLFDCPWPRCRTEDLWHWLRGKATCD